MTDTTAPAPALIGWQTLLADLSLILFMVTAAAMSDSHRPQKPPCNPALGEPLALWRAGGSQSLEGWLAAEQPDPRQQLTITAHYREGAEAAALASAQALAVQAGVQGKTARIVVAPAAATEVLATLAYDQPLPLAAQPLQDLQPLPRIRTSP